MTDQAQTILPSLDDVCELLQEAIRQMEQPDMQPVIENLARQLSGVRSIRTGTVDPLNASDICFVTTMMISVNQVSDYDRWSSDIIGQANRLIGMHEVLDDLNSAPYQQALNRLEVTYGDCLEMQRLKSPA